MKLSVLFLFLLCSFSLHATQRGARILHVEKNQHKQRNWLELAATEKQSIEILLGMLEQSSTGKKILQASALKARESGETLADIISAAEGSLTDTTLIRRFSPEAPDQVMYESRSKVTLNRHLKVREALLDLAHELTHYAYRTPFNPYNTQFNLKSFVESTVEGKGGEVEAFMVECQVFFELFPQDQASNTQCLNVIDPHSGHLSKRLGIESFYRVGAYRQKFAKEMKDFKMVVEDLPLLSEHDPLFISSAWGLPYPIAAFREYVTIMGRACDNDLKRLDVLRQNLGRAPASQNGSERLEKMLADYESRCQDFRYDLQSQRVF